MDSAKLLQRLRSSAGLLLIFDFDGTLVDIAPTPDAVSVPQDLKLLLRKLLQRPLTRVAIISGRSIDELREYIPASIPVALAGCHGCEFEMPGEIEQSILDDDEDIFDELESFAAGLKELESWPGIIVENKGCVVAMHYRLAEDNLAAHARDEFYSRAAALPLFEDMEVIEGKKVIELRPFGVNKGVAVRFLADSFLPSPDALVIYFGDDTTDLDAFSVLQELPSPPRNTRNTRPPSGDSYKQLKSQGNNTHNTRTPSGHSHNYSEPSVPPSKGNNTRTPSGHSHNYSEPSVPPSKGNNTRNTRNSLRVAVGKKIASEADYVLASPRELLELIRRLVS